MQVIHFDLTTRKFSVLPLIADPLAGYPKSRRRHSPVLHRDCFYLVPGVQNSEVIFKTNLLMIIYFFNLIFIIFNKIFIEI
jgi:hypothetical protein